MRSSKGMGSILAAGLIANLAMPAVVRAEDAAAPTTTPTTTTDAKWYDTLTIGGYIQSSYVYNLNRPTSGLNTNRVFDTEHNSFNLNAAQLKVSKPMGDDNYAFTTKLFAGRDARVIASQGTPGAGGTPGTNDEFDVQEAYVTFAMPFLKSLTLTGGKFVTLEGLEVIETPLNPTFS